MHIRILLCALVTLLAASPARSATVIFMEIYDDQGHLIQFEQDGRFGHCAIRVGHQWLHAHPRVHVELTDDLSTFGRNPEAWTNPDLPDPTPEQVRRYLAMRFNHDLKWTHDDDGTTYCSRLVGELLGIKPMPAYFMGPAFCLTHEVPGYGEVGLSPDDVEKRMRKMGFRRIPVPLACTTLFTN